MDTIEKLIDLKGKTAIVTGGANGIGLGIVKRLAEAGANVVIADVNENAGKLAAEELKNIGHKNILPLVCDVSSEDSIKDLVSITAQTFGSVDILVNNAGIYPSIPVMEMTADDFDKVIKLNLRGLFLCCQAVAKEMINVGNGGKIINITSIDALHPSSIGLAHYDASKHGAWGFTKNLALELAPKNIWVNAIAPGGINTPGATQSAKNSGVVMTEDMVKAFMNKIPMKRTGEPDDIGKVVLFLASDMSSYMTGTQIVVDGGVLLS